MAILFQFCMKLLEEQNIFCEIVYHKAIRSPAIIETIYTVKRGEVRQKIMLFLKMSWTVN